MSIHQTSKNWEHCLKSARIVSDFCAQNAATLDMDGGMPIKELKKLNETDLLLAPFPKSLGGEGLTSDPQARFVLAQILRDIGYGSLVIGRLFEGHVNAIKLVLLYGTSFQQRQLAQDVAEGAVMGVWNAEDHRHCSISGLPDKPVLHGAKAYTSGASLLTRPLITARVGDGEQVMVVLDGPLQERCDLSAWMPTGMRASATGSIDVNNLEVRPDQIIGLPGDYLREPSFSGGAWRFVAVQLGGIEALADAAISSLRTRGRSQDIMQQTRFGEISLALENARLLTAEAVNYAEAADCDLDRTLKVVDLARLAIERAGFKVSELVMRSTGLASQLRPDPMERLLRDISTYLRQPAPDRVLTRSGERLLSQGTNCWKSLLRQDNRMLN